MLLDNYKIARPYAKAIFEHAVEKNTLPAWHKTLLTLKEVMKNKRVHEIIQSLNVNQEDKKAFFVGFSSEDAIKESLDNFIGVLEYNNRLPVLAEISDLFTELFEAHQQRLHVVVKSYSKLNDLQSEKLKKALSKRFDKKIEISNEVDESLMGGVLVQAGDVVIDMSVAFQLKNMVDKLVA